jgi:uncharacterized membrane protein YGL010W
MKSLIDQLSHYAAYHRDRRNVRSHFVGIPMIVVAAAILMARPSVAVGDWFVSPALIAVVVLTLYYLTLDLRYGAAMGILLAISLAIAGEVAQADYSTWLITGTGLLAIGWACQFLGHHYEGRKPAFLDDLMSLAIGPLFVLAEAGFLLGWRKDVERAIEARQA